MAVEWSNSHSKVCCVKFDLTWFILHRHLYHLERFLIDFVSDTLVPDDLVFSSGEISAQ